MVGWLSLHTSNAGGADLVPGQGAKFPHAAQHSQKVKIFLNEKRSTCLKQNKIFKNYTFFFFFKQFRRFCSTPHPSLISERDDSLSLHYRLCILVLHVGVTAKKSEVLNAIKIFF